MAVASRPYCRKCRVHAPADAKFCPYCGALLRERTSGELRQLTVMFCDVVSSMTFARTLDPEDLSDVIAAFRTACAEVIVRFEGHIAQHLGDGLLIYFGYPVAHED